MLDAAGRRTEIPAVFRIIILLSKAIVRDQRLRRRTMVGLIGVAVVMLFVGSWAFSDHHWARAHPYVFFAYCATCAWLTLTGVLLALLDIMVIRAAGRATRRELERRFAEGRLKDPKP